MFYDSQFHACVLQSCGGLNRNHNNFSIKRETQNKLKECTSLYKILAGIEMYMNHFVI